MGYVLLWIGGIAATFAGLFYYGDASLAGLVSVFAFIVMVITSLIVLGGTTTGHGRSKDGGRIIKTIVSFGDTEEFFGVCWMLSILIFLGSFFAAMAL